MREQLNNLWKNCSCKKTLALAAISLVAFVGVAVAAWIWVVGWWEFIHCHGAPHTPTSTQMSQPEVHEDNIFEYDQCHGRPGNSGNCQDNGSGAFWKVDCEVMPYTGKKICVAQATCTNGTTLYCGGTDIEAFAGVAEEKLSGERELFAVCRKYGQDIYHNKCGL